MLVFVIGFGILVLSLAVRIDRLEERIKHLERNR